jgi:hypothetical protein
VLLYRVINGLSSEKATRIGDFIAIREHYFTEKPSRDRRSITSFFRRDPFGFAQNKFTRLTGYPVKNNE